MFTLLSVFDLQEYQLEQFGAAAAYGVLLLGDLFITKSLGPRPLLDVVTPSNTSSIILRAFAYVDVLRTVCLRGRRPIFDFIGAPGFVATPDIRPVQHTEDGTGNSDICSTLMGLPVGLMLCFAATSHLAVDEATMDPEDFRSRAFAIEKAIKAWQPSAPLAQDVSNVVDDFVTGEMWRCAALINLNQTLHRIGPLSPVVRALLRQLLSLGREDRTMGPPATATTAEASMFYSRASERACAWFFAATVAVEDAHREVIRSALAKVRPIGLGAANLRAAERIWALTDEGGVGLPNWKEVLERENMFVAFM